MVSPPPLLHAVTVLERFAVSPAKPPESGSSPQPLNFFDIIWINSGGPVERLFFHPFPHPTSHFNEAFLPNLKSSLAATLQHFYPLAGRLRLTPGSDDKYEILYTHGDSVPLILAECNGDFGEISGDHARASEKLKSLVPPLASSDHDDRNPLLAVQVTVFPNRGICLGTTVHHVVGDGTSTIHFMKSWAAACRSGSSAALAASPPLLDRTLIPDPRGFYSILLRGFQNPPAELPKNEVEKAPPPVCRPSVFATFTLRREHIEMLKKHVLARASEEGKAPFQCSAFVIAFAYTWVGIVKAKGYLADRLAHAMFAADFRGRMKPPIPPTYFGNCIGPGFVEGKAVSDLVSEGGVVTASEAVSKAIKGLEGDVLGDVDQWPEKIKAIFNQQPQTVAGSPKLKVYEVDFGWGRPAKVEVVSISETGAISLAESRDGHGGIEIGVSLPTLEMDLFTSHFNTGLQFFES